jgi:hypothetical protein
VSQLMINPHSTSYEFGFTFHVRICECGPQLDVVMPASTSLNEENAKVRVCNTCVNTAILASCEY